MSQGASSDGHWPAVVAMRLDEATLRRIDDLAARIAVPGVVVTRTDAMRAAVVAGLDHYEALHGRSAGTPSRDKSKPVVGESAPRKAPQKSVQKPKKTTR